MVEGSRLLHRRLCVLFSDWLPARRAALFGSIMEQRLQRSSGNRLAERTLRKSVARITGMRGFFSGKYERKDSADGRGSLCCDSSERCRVEDLRAACKLNDTLKELTFADCAGLSAFMTVARFERVGARVMHRGDRATFLALVLEGRVSIKLPGGKNDEPPPPIILGQGSLVGEMSYFEGGSRCADVDVCSGSEAPCALAILPYAELDGDVARAAPELAARLEECLARSTALRKFENEHRGGSPQDGAVRSLLKSKKKHAWASGKWWGAERLLAGLHARGALGGRGLRASLSGLSVLEYVPRRGGWARVAQVTFASASGAAPSLGSVAFLNFKLQLPNLPQAM